MEIGTVTSKPGEIKRGYVEVAELPTGGQEKIPVIIAEGTEPGPTLWVTASLHGDEVTGLAVAQDIIQEDLLNQLKGTVVSIPNLNPAGLRRTKRTSYYHDDDPNRYFPEFEETNSAQKPRIQELINKKIYDHIVDSADAVIDLHTAQIGSVPITIHDRVRFGADRTKEEASALSEELRDLLEAFGLPIVNGHYAEENIERGLHRTTPTSALDIEGIPGFTAELGTNRTVDQDMKSVGVAGCYRVMKRMEMIDTIPKNIIENDTEITTPVDYPVKLAIHPHTGKSGIARFHVEAGDSVESGDPIADIVTPHGTHITTVKTEYDGFIIGRYEGVAKYKNDPLVWMAARDEGNLVVSRNTE